MQVHTDCDPPHPGTRLVGSVFYGVVPPLAKLGWAFPSEFDLCHVSYVLDHTSETASSLLQRSAPARGSKYLSLVAEQTAPRLPVGPFPCWRIAWCWGSLGDSPAKAVQQHAKKWETRKCVGGSEPGRATDSYFLERHMSSIVWDVQHIHTISLNIDEGLGGYEPCLWCLSASMVTRNAPLCYMQRLSGAVRGRFKKDLTESGKEKTPSHLHSLGTPSAWGLSASILVNSVCNCETVHRRDGQPLENKYRFVKLLPQNCKWYRTAQLYGGRDITTICYS